MLVVGWAPGLDSSAVKHGINVIFGPVLHPSLMGFAERNV